MFTHFHHPLAMSDITDAAVILEVKLNYNYYESTWPISINSRIPSPTRIASHSLPYPPTSLHSRAAQVDKADGRRCLLRRETERKKESNRPVGHLVSSPGEDAARGQIPHRHSDYFHLFEPPINALVVVDVHLQRQEPLSDFQHFIGMCQFFRHWNSLPRKTISRVCII